MLAAIATISFAANKHEVNNNAAATSTAAHNIKVAGGNKLNDTGSVALSNSDGIEMDYYNSLAEAMANLSDDRNWVFVFGDQKLTDDIYSSYQGYVTICLSGNTVDGSQEDGSYYTIDFQGSVDFVIGTVKANISNGNVGFTNTLGLSGVNLSCSSINWLTNGVVFFEHGEMNLGEENGNGSFAVENFFLGDEATINFKGVSNIGCYGNVPGGLKDIYHRLQLSQGLKESHPTPFEFGDKNYQISTVDDEENTAKYTITIKNTDPVTPCAYEHGFSWAYGYGICHLCPVCYGMANHCAIAEDDLTNKQDDKLALSSFSFEDLDNYIQLQNLLEMGSGKYTELNVEQFQYMREFREDQIGVWQSLYVPFAMAYEDWQDECDIYKLNNIFENDPDDDGIVNEWVLRVIKLGPGSTIQPNTHYAMKPKKKNVSINIQNATLTDTQENEDYCASLDYKFVFKGTLEPKTIQKDTYFALSDGELKYSNEDITLGAQRWYMAILDKKTGAEIKPSTFNPQTHDAKAIRIYADGEDDATAIHPINTVRTSKDVIYNISGQRLSAPQKGINIINGRKEIVK